MEDPVLTNTDVSLWKIASSLPQMQVYGLWLPSPLWTFSSASHRWNLVLVQKPSSKRFKEIAFKPPALWNRHKHRSRYKWMSSAINNILSLGEFSFMSTVYTGKIPGNICLGNPVFLGHYTGGSAPFIYSSFYPQLTY